MEAYELRLALLNIFIKCFKNGRLNFLKDIKYNFFLARQ